jgi:low molecular weight protein-tyrosine phosphatase
MSLPEPTGSPYRIAFVCLGNICRSPMAQVVLTELVESSGLAGKVEVTSCGTGTWHLGEPMDPRAAAQLKTGGYDASAHRARKYDPTWLENDLVLAMDAQNLEDITDGRGSDERVRMFRSLDPLADPDDLDVPDPFYAGDESFVQVLDIVERTCRQILDELQELPLQGLL